MAAVVAVVAAVVAAVAVVAAEDASASRMIQVSNVATVSTAYPSNPTNEAKAAGINNFTEINKFFKIIEQTNELNLTQVVNTLHYLDKFGKVNMSQLNHLVSLVFQMNQVNITEISDALNSLDQTSQTNSGDPTQTASSDEQKLTQPRVDYSSCTNKPTLVTLTTGQTYTFTSPGFPGAYITWFQDCRYSFKTANSADSLRLKCPTKSMSWGSTFQFTNCTETIVDDCFMFCAGDRPIDAKLGTSTKIKFTNGLFGTPGYNCSVTAEPPPCECGSYYKPKVVGGSEAHPLSYGWMASLAAKEDNTHRCGASLISPYWLLTAAHCTVDMDTANWRIRLGLHKTTEDSVVEISRNILEIINHPKYNSKTHDYDYALIRIAYLDLTAYRYIKAVCLAGGSHSFAGRDATVAGWGRTSETAASNSPVLMEAVVNVKTNAYCNQQYSGANGTVTDRMLCANAPKADTCKGDSGGPLFLKGVAATQIGVVSWGKPCADPNYPTVYARVTDQREWIDKIVTQKCTPVKY